MNAGTCECLEVGGGKSFIFPTKGNFREKLVSFLLET